MKKYATFLVAGLVLLSLGLFLAHCGGGDDGGCSSNADCAATEFCDLTTKTCKPGTSCDHAERCLNKCCGDDGCPSPQACVNNCGTGMTCNPTTCACDPCTPNCTGRECGPDPNCGEICGTCDTGEICTNGTCEPCTPDCTGRVCGPDANNCPGASCGDCDPGYTCVNGACEAGVTAPGDPCPNGPSDCPDPWDVCLEGGGLTYCTKACVTGADCGGEPNCCEDFGIGAYCWDETQCPGIGEPGDPCPFDGVNDGAEQCGAGLSCLGIGATGTAGTCPGGDPAECTELSSSYNPDCVGNNCGASFCSEPCDNGACPASFVPMEIDGLGCMCTPEPDSECTDPANNVGCDANQTCVPVGGAALQCFPAGDVELWAECDADHPCVEGHVCMSLGSVDRCFKLCDSDAQTGCPGTGDWYCWGWSDVDRWGFCSPNDLCNMGSDECTQIDDGLACIVFESDPCETRCFGTSGQAAGTACSYSNSCADGLICAGTPGTCTDVCLDNAECTAPDVCLDEPTCDGTWGICGTE